MAINLTIKGGKLTAEGDDSFFGKLVAGAKRVTIKTPLGNPQLQEEKPVVKPAQKKKK